MEIAVGLSISLTGRFQYQGQQVLQGVHLWQEYINAQGGMKFPKGEARAVRLVWYDDHSRTNDVRENVRKLLRGNTDILLGPYSSSLTMAAAEIAEEARKVLWNYGGSSDEIFRQGWRYLVATCSPASDYLRALPGWLAEQQSELNKICVLYSSRGTFGWQVARGITESARHINSCSVQLLPSLDSAAESSAMLSRVLIEAQPQVVILAGGFQEDVTILRSRRLWPDSVREVAAVAAGVRAFVAELGREAEGVLGPSQWEPEISFPGLIGPHSNWFVRNFQAQFGHPPDYPAAAVFATGLVMAEAARLAGSLADGDLRDVVSTLDCHTFFGRFRIDGQTGIQTGHRVLLIRWREGEKVVIA